MKSFTGPLCRTPLASKTACLGGLAGVVGLLLLVSTASAIAEPREVQIDCREGLTKKVVLFPNEDGVSVALTGCMCGSAEEIAALKERLKAQAATVVAQRARGQTAVLPAGGAPVYNYPIAPGEKRDITFYCYTPEQVTDYYARAEKAAAGE